MRRQGFTRGLALLAAWALGACGTEGDDNSFPMVLESEFGLFRALLSPLSEPLVVGSNEFELQIFERISGSPAEGLELDVLPWMPHHDHGSPVEPSVEELGEGLYRIRGVAFNMEGEWELWINLSKDAVRDLIVASFRV